MTARSTILRRLTADDIERLLLWYAESYQDGVP